MYTRQTRSNSVHSGLLVTREEFQELSLSGCGEGSSTNSRLHNQGTQPVVCSPLPESRFSGRTWRVVQRAILFADGSPVQSIDWRLLLSYCGHPIYTIDGKSASARHCFPPAQPVASGLNQLSTTFICFLFARC